MPVDTDPLAPFVLGGSVRIPRHVAAARGALPSIFSIGTILAVIALPARGLYRATGSSMEEGFMLVFPRLVQQGRVPNADFLHLYGPTSLDVLALWYRLAGDTLESQRTFGLLQHMGIIFGLYALTRAWGHVVAVGAAMVATLLIVTPIGLSALAWHGGLGLGLWSLVFALRSRTTGRSSDAWWAGGLAGLALGYRPDLLLALGLAVGFAVWSSRPRRRTVVLGAAIGLLPMWVHLGRAGPVAAFEGMVIDPVVRLRPGRELPRPPGWSEIDGALQAVAEGAPPWWDVPAPAASQQLFLWFFTVIVIAISIPVIALRITRRLPDPTPATTPQATTPPKTAGLNGDVAVRQTAILMSAGLFGVGILPQALQRPDSTHLAWVSVVSWALLVPALAMLLREHLPDRRRALAATAIVGVLMAVVCPFYTYRHYLLHTRVSAGNLPLPFLVERDEHRFWFGDGFVALALNEMIPDLDARSEPGDRLIVGPADLSRTIYSDVSVYYLFPELEPATYFIEMDPGLADATDSGLADDIADADFLVLTNIWTGWNEPNASDEHLSQEHNQAVADHFCLVEQYQSNLVLLFERCDGGGGVNPSEVDGRFPAAGDEG